MPKSQRSREPLAIVRAAILREGLIRPRSRVLVACSGGPDSTVLLHLLAELSGEVPFSLAVAHFNHRLRAAADADERFVRKTARALGLPLVVGRRDVRAYARSRKLNLEEASRGLRYAFLERTAVRTRSDVIATGHTLNDQAETLLMRLLRGSGPRGLSAILPSLGGRVVRPLLGVTRSEIVGCCRRRGWAFREDESNRDRSLLRNRIRLDLIPYLERRFEKRAVRALGRTARIIQDEDAWLEAAARRAYARLAAGRGPSAALDAAGLARLPAGPGRRVVRAFFEELRGDLRRFTFDDVEAVRNLADGAVRVLPGALRVRREGNRLSLDRGRQMKREGMRDFACSWDGRAPLFIPGAGWAFRARRVKTKPRPADFDDRIRAFCDAASLRFPLEVSARRSGDRYRPLGAPGTKKLKEILRERRIPPGDRAGIPVVRSGKDIVWSPGLPVADRFKVTAATKTVFSVEASRTGRPSGQGER